jgi:hypothetical protein
MKNPAGIVSFFPNMELFFVNYLISAALIGNSSELLAAAWGTCPPARIQHFALNTTSPFLVVFFFLKKKLPYLNIC